MRFILTFWGFSKTKLLYKYLFFFLLLCQHLLVLLPNFSRILIKLYLEFLFGGRQLFLPPRIPQLLNHRMILLHNNFLQFLLQVVPPPVIPWIMRQSRREFHRIHVLLHNFLVPSHQHRMVFDVNRRLDVLMPHFYHLPVHLITVNLKFLHNLIDTSFISRN